MAVARHTLVARITLEMSQGEADLLCKYLVLMGHQRPEEWRQKNDLIYDIEKALRPLTTL